MKKIVKKIISGALALGMVAALMPGMSFTAKAEDNIITITQPSEGATISTSPSGSIAGGDTLSVTVTLAEGWEWDSPTVTVDSTICTSSPGTTSGGTSASDPYVATFTITDGTSAGSLEVTASGFKKTEYTLTFTNGAGGTVAETNNATGAVKDAAVNLTITPDTGYKLDTLTAKDADDNDVSVTITDGEGSFTMPASNVTVTSTWKEAATVTVGTGNHGSAEITNVTKNTMNLTTVESPYFASAEEKVTLSKTADKGYTFERWDVTPSGAATMSGDVLTMPAGSLQDVTVTPVFIKSSGTEATTDDSAATEDGETTEGEDGETTDGENGEDGQTTDGEEGQSTDGENGDSATENPFTDVVKSGDNDPYYDAIVWAAKNNVVKGKSETSYDPNGTATRVEFTTMMHRLLKDIVPGNPGKTSKFADCQNLIEDFTNAILWAESLEPAIIQGVDANNFAPNAPITRAQVVTLIWRAAGSPEPKSATTAFTDLTADYYKKAVAWGVEQGIVKGTSATTFAPDQPVTRAQLATFLYRAVVEAKVFSSAPADDASTGTASDETATDETKTDGAAEGEKTGEAAEGEKTEA